MAGIGYAEAAGQAVQDQLKRKLRLMAVSEVDLRHAIGECVIAGIPASADATSVGHAVVTTGLRVISDDEPTTGPCLYSACSVTQPPPPSTTGHLPPIHEYPPQLYHYAPPPPPPHFTDVGPILLQLFVR